MIDDNLILILLLLGIVGAAFVALNARRPIVFLYAAIFCTAILKTPQLPVVREKFTATEVFMLLTWLFASQLPRLHRHLPSDRVVKPLAIAFVLSCIVSGMIGLASVPATTIDMPRVYASVFVEIANYIYGVLIVLTVIRAIDRWERLTGAVFAWILGMTVASFVGVLATVHLAPGFAYEEGTRRICSTLRNENQVPSMILPLITLPIMASAHRHLGLLPRIAMLGLTAMAFLTALGTGSRTAVLMLIFAAVALGLVLTQDSKARLLFNLGQLRSFAFFFAIAVVSYFVVAWAAYDGNYSLMRTPSWQRPAALLIEAYNGKRDLDSTRPQQFKVAMEQFWKTPVFGTGPKLGARVAQTHGEVHNTYFSLLLETGIVGLLLHLALLFQAARFCWIAVQRCPFHWYRMMGKALLIGLVLLVLYNNTMLGLRQRNIWFLVGFMFAYGNLVMLKVPPPRTLKLPFWLKPWTPFFVDHSGYQRPAAASNS
ncbi:O-antigen ligase family protein [Rosistilla oblonga]|uniref:O-antigen ligase family protein n=1 Tax=Rosistilla oblonga TaxID=2527990 RepID=UPI003A9776F4